MASKFVIVQSGKPIEIRPKVKVTNNMPNPSWNAIQTFRFYFNNDTNIYAGGGGGFGYGGSRDTEILGIKSASDFPLTITSYDYNHNKTSGMDYTINIPSYTYSDYQHGRVIEIIINSYIYNG